MNTPHSTPATTPGVVSIKSAHTFADTLERLQATFKAHGLKVFATIDHQAEAAAVGLTMPPTVLLIFGNAKAGTPLMLAHPLAALDLPLKALVSEAVPGSVMVSFNTPQYLVERHALPHELVVNLAPAGRLITQALGH
ncbi:DUF302 domain-containing protein [Polaromonas sp. C04]|uniref:DUF302 domain-containing protein n=1 Tax=Polaromonas sp. C04 TaxID=1945857 RepID=UPI000986AA08|nr:DUF302 domain-containing protein [Polaromonas sp. C04]OOG51615.1 hypothetical protein B0E49_15295 [Polaromonas sp. C04]